MLLSIPPPRGTYITKVAYQTWNRAIFEATSVASVARITRSCQLVIRSLSTKAAPYAKLLESVDMGWISRPGHEHNDANCDWPGHFKWKWSLYHARLGCNEKALFCIGNYSFTPRTERQHASSVTRVLGVGSRTDTTHSSQSLQGPMRSYPARLRLKTNAYMLTETGCCTAPFVHELHFLSSPNDCKQLDSCDILKASRRSKDLDE
jgi:hypothetical protein